MKFEKADEQIISITLTGAREEVQRLLDALTARKRSAEERSAVAELVAGLSKALGIKPTGKTMADVFKQATKPTPIVSQPDSAA